MHELKKTIDILSTIKDHKKENFSFADLDTLLHKLVETHEPTGSDDHLIKDLKKITMEVKSIRADLKACKDGDSDTFDILPLSILDLTEVMKILEQSANAIMSASEKLSSIKSSEPAVQTAINEATGEIFQNCTFQDLTGQRIVRVTKNLEKFQHITLGIIKALLGSEYVPQAKENLNYKFAGLENGPQLAQTAKSQDDIDKLFGA